MTFLTATAGIALLVTIAIATGVLCYAMLSMLNRLEVAAVRAHPAPDPSRRHQPTLR